MHANRANFVVLIYNEHLISPAKTQELEKTPWVRNVDFRVYALLSLGGPTSKKT